MVFSIVPCQLEDIGAYILKNSHEKEGCIWLGGRGQEVVVIGEDLGRKGDGLEALFQAH